MIDIEVLFSSLPCSFDKIAKSLELVVLEENLKLGSCAVIFGDDNWLLGYNKSYLNHDYYTDIITFDYSENDIISGDLLISLERVFENAEKWNVSRETECLRVVIHGALHLCGYGDIEPDDITIMRNKEDYYLTRIGV